MELSLALGGGGAKGNAHIGVLSKLEKEGFQIRSIAGTSFGGLVAILYGLGKTPPEIQAAFESIDQNQLFGHEDGDGPSLLGFAGVRKFLKELLGDKTFSDLKIPCAVTAVNIKTGEEITLSEGKLLDAVLATIALPGIFPASELNGWELVDGGVLNPVPVSVARELSPNFPVAAVVLNSPMDQPVRGYRLPLPGIFPRPIAERLSRISLAQSYDIFMRSVDISSRAVAHFRLQLDKPEVIIRPKVYEIDILDKIIVADVVRLGEQAVEAVLPELFKAVSWQNRLAKKLFKFTS